jgi:hypothetical protein
MRVGRLKVAYQRQRLDAPGAIGGRRGVQREQRAAPAGGRRGQHVTSRRHRGPGGGQPVPSLLLIVRCSSWHVGRSDASPQAEAEAVARHARAVSTCMNYNSGSVAHCGEDLAEGLVADGDGVCTGDRVFGLDVGDGLAEALGEG